MKNILVSDEQRQQLIEFIKNGHKITEAAKATGLNYENAKAIIRVYRLEGRTDSKKYRMRFKVGETKEQILVRKQKMLEAKLAPTYR